MFDRYTLAARRVIFHARAGATEIGGTKIDSDLLLWGLATEAPELLDELCAGALRDAVAADRAEAEKAALGKDLPLTACAAKALQRADEEARRLGVREVRVVHVLLGLLADRESPAGVRFARLGIVSEQVRALAREPRVLALDDRHESDAGRT